MPKSIRSAPGRATSTPSWNASAPASTRWRCCAGRCRCSAPRPPRCPIRTTASTPSLPTRPITTIFSTAFWQISSMHGRNRLSTLSKTARQRRPMCRPPIAAMTNWWPRGSAPAAARARLTTNTAHGWARRCAKRPGCSSPTACWPSSTAMPRYWAGPPW
ncbi:Uncharacterised protein [Bordetella pertussis]|nr:Uncharacterised protein [Bordetella pertussis]